jgi:hypothetical protein
MIGKRKKLLARKLIKKMWISKISESQMRAFLKVVPLPINFSSKTLLSFKDVVLAGKEGRIMFIEVVKDPTKRSIEGWIYLYINRKENRRVVLKDFDTEPFHHITEHPFYNDEFREKYNKDVNSAKIPNYCRLPIL